MHRRPERAVLGTLHQTAARDGDRIVEPEQHDEEEAEPTQGVGGEDGVVREARRVGAGVALLHAEQPLAKEDEADACRREREVAVRGEGRELSGMGP